jgi:hypothetical protein
MFIGITLRTHLAPADFSFNLRYQMPHGALTLLCDNSAAKQILYGSDHVVVLKNI